MSRDFRFVAVRACGCAVVAFAVVDDDVVVCVDDAVCAVACRNDRLDATVLRTVVAVVATVFVAIRTVLGAFRGAAFFVAVLAAPCMRFSLESILSAAASLPLDVVYFVAQLTKTSLSFSSDALLPLLFLRHF